MRGQEQERGRCRERGGENEQKRAGANFERGNGEERENATKASERCSGCLALFDTFSSDSSSPFAVPSTSPLSQRACQCDPRGHDPRHRATRVATVRRSGNNNKKHLSRWSKEWWFYNFSGFAERNNFELKLERTSFFRHLHSMHLKNDSIAKPRFPCNNTQFSSKIILGKDVKRKHADFILILGCEKKEPCT